MSDKANEPGFRVVDRRRFTEAGETRSDAETSPPSSSQPSQPPPAHVPPTEAPPKPRPEPHRSGPLPPLEFSHFVLSLATSAQVAMGLVANPESKVVHHDLPAARQTIDILSMLQAKTKGNLSTDEARLMEEVLYTLRMQFVQVSQPKPGDR